MISYLVTGAAGFIGANFVKFLIDKYNSDVNIIILDALTYAGHLETINDIIALPNVTFVKGDIGDYELVCHLLKEHNPDFVVNFAAESHVDRSITGPRVFIETNVLGTQTLLDACREAWRKPDGTYAEGHRFLQISTDEVY
ncbi:MAG: GDP-mannose 4,6-dehydratase, partial [Acutalibacteraceae bacterium]|nr:GDP-mannose 4,6-dehydratase [Acutalibacteraceae bacterium]